MPTQIMTITVNEQGLASSAQSSAIAAATSATEAAASAAAAQAAENSLLEWKGAWVTATSYAPSDLVRQDGATYVCLVAHTSGTFSTDLSSAYWEIFAQKGDPGPGTGDVLASNNGSEYTASASTFRANVGAQAQDTDLDAIAALARARGDLMRGGASAWERLALGSTGEVIGSDGTDLAYLGVMAWERVGSVIVASASTDVQFVFDPAKYVAYQIRIANAVPATDNVRFYAQFSSNGGSSFDNGASDYSFTLREHNPSNVSSVSLANNTAIQITSDVGSDPGEDGVSCDISINGPDLAKKTNLRAWGNYTTSSGNEAYFDAGGCRKQSAAHDAVRLFFSGSDIESGEFVLLGLRG